MSLSANFHSRQAASRLDWVGTGRGKEAPQGKTPGAPKMDLLWVPIPGNRASGLSEVGGFACDCSPFSNRGKLRP